jgi:polyphosphate kinase
MDTIDDHSLHELIGADLRDSLDEELELELDDRELDQFRRARPTNNGQPELDRHLYFKELFRLQGMLVKLQDWVQHSKLKVVITSRGVTPPAKVA